MIKPRQILDLKQAETTAKPELHQVELSTLDRPLLTQNQNEGCETSLKDVFVQALCFAVQYGQEGSVLKLLQLGADKTIKTKSGKTPADLADQFKYTQVGVLWTHLEERAPHKVERPSDPP